MRLSCMTEVSATPSARLVQGSASQHGIAESSVLCDVYGMALLSHFPALRNFWTFVLLRALE